MNALDTRPTGELSTNRQPIRSLVKLWAASTSIAILLACAAYLVANAGSGPLVVTEVGEIALSNVVGFTVLGGTVGATLAYLAGRFARRPRLTFLAVTIIALAGYAVVPFTAAESTQTAVWLNVFHVVVAIPVIGMLTRYLPESRTTTEA